MGNSGADRVDTAARLSHEVRHPVSAMMGMIELLSDTQLDEVQRRYVDALRSTSEHLLALLSDAFDPEHTQDERPSVARAEFRVLEIVEQAVEMAVSRIRKPSVAVTSHVGMTVPRNVIGDAGRLRQVLLNVLINALKFTERGEVVVKVDVASSGALHELVAVVNDTGVGIDAARLRELEASRPDVGASGLGLKICRQLVEQMGGTFHVESEVGKGTTVRVAVPVSPAERPDTRSLTTSVSLAGRNALVLAESSTQRMVLVENMRAWGGDACGYGSASKLLERLSPDAIARAPIDVLIIDDHLLGEDGPRLYRELSAAQHLDAVQIVWISADGLDQPVPAGWRVLRKPVRRRELAMALSTAPREPREAVAGPSLLWPSGRSFCVMVVDDSPESRMVVRHYLAACPLRVEEAASGVEAVLRAESERPDLVLLDLQMPGMSGIETAKALRAMEARVGHGRCRIVFLSAAGKLPRAEALAAGGDAYATKPIRRDALVTLIHHELCGSTQGSSNETQRVVVLNEAIAALVPAFLRGRWNDLRAIREAVQRRDFAAIQLIAHTIKGLGGTYGFSYVTHLGAEIDLLAGRRDVAGIESACAALETHLRAIPDGKGRRSE